MIVASFVVVMSVVYQQVSKLQSDISDLNYREMTGSRSLETIQEPKDIRESLCVDFYQVVCKDNQVISDPTGSVQPDINGEVEALRLYETILHRHPNWSNEQVDQELVSRIYTPRRKKMLLEIYDWIQKEMINFIQKQSNQVISWDSKEELIRRIKLIDLQVPPPASLYANEPDLFTKNDVYYESFPGDKRVIRVGGAYLLSAKSWFNRVFTIAHEMSHAIDPCELELSKIKIEGYEKLLQCFQMEKNIDKNQLRMGCAKNSYLGELFADWLATQITVRALEFYSSKFKNSDDLSNSIINSVKDLCHQELSLNPTTDSHPDSKIRVEKIFGRNPSLRRMLGCPKEGSTGFYCSFEGKMR